MPKIYCELPEDINECKYFVREENLCQSPDAGCSFRRDETTKKTEENYQRPEKWFEKYMR